MNRLASRAVVALFVPLAACTGATLGEKNPGADTHLEYGAIAVDDRSDTCFVLQSREADGVESKSLVAVHPDTETARTVLDLTGRNDARILFPKSGILVMSESGEKDRLDLLDPTTFQPLESASPGVRYHGTRMSPSREHIVVADNTSEHAPLHVIDAATLSREILPHDGDWLEAMWMNGRDTLLAVVFYDMFGTAPRARILSWNVSDVVAAGFARDEAGFWTKRILDIDVPDTNPDMLFSFTWVGVSPDDRHAVFPVIGKDEIGADRHELLVLSTETGEVRKVPDAKGPVGFTPDGSTIVSYTGAESVDQSLLLINADTLEKDVQDVPIDGGITYFVSHEGNYVVVASNWGDQRLALFDVDNGKVTEMVGPAVGLNEFVSRLGHGELWLVDQQALFRLDLNAGELETVNTSFAPEHINILRGRDWLVLDDARSDQLFFFDPGDKSTVATVKLPGSSATP
jgi:DNA-binding beta-propeller fold protein YncE